MALRRGHLEAVAGELVAGRFRWLASQAVKVPVVAASRLIPGGRAVVGPLMGGLLVTYRCNELCAMCDLPDRADRSEPDTAWFLDLVDQFAELGVAGVSVDGGEPLLRQDAIDILKHISHRGMLASLSTNGLLLDDRRVARIIDAAPHGVNISIDGATAATHDALRGVPGAFEKTVAAVRRLVTAVDAAGSRTKVAVVCVVSRANVHELEDVARLAASLGVHRLGFMPWHSIPMPRDGAKKVISRGPGVSVIREPALQGVSLRLRGVPKLLKGSRTQMENSPEYLDLFDRAFAGKEFPHPCNAGYTMLGVDCYGRYYPCHSYMENRRPAGELRGRRLVEIWNSPELRATRIETSTCRSCYWDCHAELSMAVPVL